MLMDNKGNQELEKHIPSWLLTCFTVTYLSAASSGTVLSETQVVSTYSRQCLCSVHRSLLHYYIIPGPCSISCTLAPLCFYFQHPAAAAFSGLPIGCCCLLCCCAPRVKVPGNVHPLGHSPSAMAGALRTMLRTSLHYVRPPAGLGRTPLWEFASYPISAWPPFLHSPTSSDPTHFFLGRTI